MKNPFIEMALMMATMQAAFRENALRDAGVGSNWGSRGRSRIPGKRQPAGTKLARAASKQRIGLRFA